MVGLTDFEVKPSTPDASPFGSEEATAAASDPLVGELIGEFRVVGRIGSGLSGVTYEAWATSGAQVAIKVLKSELAADTAYAEKLIDNVREVAKLNHPGIVQIHNVGKLPDKRPFVVMARIEGETLETWTSHQGPLALPTVTAFGVQLASALGAAHAEGIVHGDLNFKSVFVIRSKAGPVLKLIDFGSSRVPQGAGLGLEVGLPGFVGTPWVMAPEQIRGERISPRSDLYSLGAVLYRLLTGAPPFQATNATEVVVQHLGEPAPNPRTLRPETPVALAKLVLSLLEKDPKDRPPTAQAVEQAVLTAAIPASRPSGVKQTQPLSTSRASQPGVKAPRGSAPVPSEPGARPAQPPAARPTAAAPAAKPPAPRPAVVPLDFEPPPTRLDRPPPIDEAPEPTTVLPSVVSVIPAAFAAPDDDASTAVMGTPLPEAPVPMHVAAGAEDPSITGKRTLDDLIAQPVPSAVPAAFEESRAPVKRTKELKEPKEPKPKKEKPHGHGHEGFLSRWWPALAFGAIVLGVVGFIATRPPRPKPVEPQPVQVKPTDPPLAGKDPVALVKKPHGPLSAKGLLTRCEALNTTMQKDAPQITYDARVELRRLKRRAEAKPDAAEMEAISDELDAWESFYLHK